MPNTHGLESTNTIIMMASNLRLRFAGPALLCVASAVLLYSSPPPATADLLAADDCRGILVQRGFTAHCNDDVRRTTRATATLLAMKQGQLAMKQGHTHQDWCNRWCLYEKTSADCGSCVRPSFPGYMARMKASERLADQGWGIHIPSNGDLHILDAARELGKKAPDAGKVDVVIIHAGSVSPKTHAVGGFVAQPRLGAISSQARVAINHFSGKDVAGKQALYQLTSRDMTMESLESSETADEGRLVADEERLDRDRAIKQRIFKLRVEKQQKQKQGNAGMAAFLASRHWHSADAKAVTALLSARATGAALKPLRVPRIMSQTQREMVRRSIENNLDPRKHTLLTVQGQAAGAKLHKLNLMPEYELPGGFSNGLPDPVGSAAAAPYVNMLAHSRQHGRGACHNAYDCFGSLLEGNDLDKGHYTATANPAKAHFIDPKAFIKGQGLGCHSLGNCLGSFFQGKAAAQVIVCSHVG